MPCPQKDQKKKNLDGINKSPVSDSSPLFGTYLTASVKLHSVLYPSKNTRFSKWPTRWSGAGANVLCGKAGRFGLVQCEEEMA